MLRIAIAVRLDLAIAICMAKLNGAENYRLHEREIVTRHRVESVKVSGGLAVADVAHDLLKIAVVERHHASSTLGLGFLHGLGLKRGGGHQRFVATSSG